MLWLLLTWIALGLVAACLFGETAGTMREDHRDDDSAPAEEGYEENLLA
ncbi:hypothetical protein SVA_0464 [Sulfurifustis variabilis]|uniref:Uncharacterized protein n=1 Tax=Sulfurifustis variabilis TaxID=1675686 RepID=A0A1B4V1A4_9GAMM|nr:hypothetical protein [Sulfurifustis variabilis]BAU47045.1 hypothetical protein SVA_0464 [Sulfurifustis variabilis]